MMFAGVWSSARVDGVELKTCAVVTTSANQFMSKIHDRMPVILPDAHWKQWLGDADLERVRGLIRPADESLLASHPVSTRVNKVNVDEPGLMDPVEPETTGQLGLFG